MYIMTLKTIRYCITLDSGRVPVSVCYGHIHTHRFDAVDILSFPQVNEFIPQKPTKTSAKEEARSPLNLALIFFFFVFLSCSFPISDPNKRYK